MDVIFKIISIGLIGAILSIILKKHNPEFALITSVLVGIFIFYLIYSSLESAISSINQVIGKLNIDSSIIGIIFKICGIGLVSEYFCNVISDAGESAIAKKIEIATKIVIFVMIIPLIIKVVEYVIA